MSGQCLSPSVADHSLKPATRLSLGEPLPHQLADMPRAHLRVTGPPKRIPIFPIPHFKDITYPVLASLSTGYPEL